jgi:dephospho-CoA kinase
MLELRKIAITGGLSSGKSEVCQIFKKFGAHIISADEIGHDILESDLESIEKLQKLFGPDVQTNGRLDRKKLANKVFCDEKKLRELEYILHPRIAEKIKKACAERRESLVVVEIPLLFEARWQDNYGATIAVVSPENLCRERSMKKGFDYDTRMQHQLPQSEKAKLADFVIDNGGTIKNLKPQVKKIIDLLNNKG